LKKQVYLKYCILHSSSWEKRRRINFRMCDELVY